MCESASTRRGCVALSRPGSARSTAASSAGRRTLPTDRDAARTSSSAPSTAAAELPTHVHRFLLAPALRRELDKQRPAASVAEKVEAVATLESFVNLLPSRLS